MRDAFVKTRITDLLGIRHPILCGGMGPGVSDAKFVAAVVNAGGMGFIVAAHHADSERFRDELQLCKSLAPGKRLGVNFYLSRFRPVVDQYPRHIEVMAEEGVDVAETAGQSPEKILPALREAGITVIHKVASIKHAIASSRSDVDAVTLISGDAAGHIGASPLGTMVNAGLAPRAIAHKPLVIGGGIGNGNQLAGALMMGADAVLMATRMLVASELWIHEEYKQMIVRSDASATRIVMDSLNNPARVLDNETAQEIAAMEKAGVTDPTSYYPLISGRASRAAYQNGEHRRGMLGIGPAMAFAERVEPVEAIFDDIIDEAKKAARRFDVLKWGVAASREAEPSCA